MNQHQFLVRNDDGTAEVVVSRPLSFVEKLMMAGLKRAHDRFLASSTFEALKSKDPSLFQRFSEQAELLDTSRRVGSRDDIKRHGEALLRGYDAITECMAEKGIDLNAARPQKGTVVHPGRPPALGSPAHKRWYAAYLDTFEWAERRDKVLARADGLCEGCGSAEATQVHHLTYAHVGYEFLFELTAICAACHGRLHGKTPP